jgi:homoserine O-succinyltransferase
MLPGRTAEIVTQVANPESDDMLIIHPPTARYPTVLRPTRRWPFMPLEIQHPAPALPDIAADAGPYLAGSLTIGVVNNMPDPALEGTESQFNSVLAAASGARPVRVRYYALPEVPRAAAAQARIAARYWPLKDLYDAPPDALIVTGTEPRAASLRDEPYWKRMVEILDFARAATACSIWSCLAAHAAVLQLDGIERRRLATKLFGVFEHAVLPHPLTTGIETPLSTPHSRWNELPVDALRSAGYRILSWSSDTGADAFLGSGAHPLLCFQGHPEYEGRTLLKEYQRDVGRFIAGEYPAYPKPPRGYFGAGAIALLSDFERRLRAGELGEPLSAFPFAALAASLDTRWRSAAVRLYSNWLSLVAERSTRVRAVGAPSRARRDVDNSGVR